MATFNVPFLVPKTNKSGRTSWYWQPSAALRRDGWKPVKLGADEAAAIEAARAQNDKVDQWKSGGSRPAVVRRIVRQATVSALIRQYKEEGWPSVRKPGTFIAPGTRDTYAAMFKTIETWAGDVPLAAIDPDRVSVFRDALMKPAAAGRYKGTVRHTAAHSTLRVLRTLFTYAEQKRLIPKGTNPADDFRLSMPDPRDQVWWAPAREALLETAAADPDLELAIDLAFSIGQREGDLLRKTISCYVEIPPYKIEDLETYKLLAAVPVPAYGGRPGYIPGDVRGIRLRQAKGGRWLEVPIVGMTRARLEAAIARAMAAAVTTILFDDRTNRPWGIPTLKAGQRRFTRRFAQLREDTIHRLLGLYADHDDAEAMALALDVDELQFRDFRRTAVVFLGELGIADHLIAAITLHSLDETKRILDTYLPRTTGMAARAIALSQARAPATIEKEQKA